MRKRLTSALVTGALALGLTAAGSGAASAGTADYQYTCATPGQSSWAMPAGTPLRDCANGNVEVRLNGSLVEIIPVNAEGARLQERVWTKDDVLCIVAVFETGYLLLKSRGAAAWADAGFAATGLHACTA